MYAFLGVLYFQIHLPVEGLRILGIGVQGCMYHRDTCYGAPVKEGTQSTFASLLILMGGGKLFRDPGSKVLRSKQTRV